MTEPVESPTDDQVAAWHRTFAPMAFNETWAYLDRDSLSREEEVDMLSATLAQRYHWKRVGTPRHHAIADWQVSRVAVVLGYADLARRFGEISLDTCIQHDLDPFVTGFAHEALARAAASVDDVETFNQHLALAREMVPRIEDDEDRGVLASDLAEMSED